MPYHDKNKGKLLISKSKDPQYTEHIESEEDKQVLHDIIADLNKEGQLDSILNVLGAGEGQNTQVILDKILNDLVVRGATDFYNLGDLSGGIHQDYDLLGSKYRGSYKPVQSAQDTIYALSGGIEGAPMEKIMLHELLHGSGLEHSPYSNQRTWKENIDYLYSLIEDQNNLKDFEDLFKDKQWTPQYKSKWGKGQY